MWKQEYHVIKAMDTPFNNFSSIDARVYEVHSSVHGLHIS